MMWLDTSATVYCLILVWHRGAYLSLWGQTISWILNIMNCCLSFACRSESIKIVFQLPHRGFVLSYPVLSKKTPAKKREACFLASVRGKIGLSVWQG